MGIKFLFGDDKNVPVYDSSDGCMKEYAKKYWIAQFKRVNFIICKLHLNRVVIKKEEAHSFKNYWRLLLFLVFFYVNILLFLFLLIIAGVD